ncbi:hypothetical protein ABTY61_41025 [Kitasatospora sp. NPDC096128]|uniref:hypothetical protein n=1 Tax=Kitasatospora sp. NPDC096128 TaxID=3155547 RepID=UPI00331E8F4B
MNNRTNHRLWPAQQRRQWLFGALFLAFAAYIAFRTLTASGPVSPRTAVGGPFMVLLGLFFASALIAGNFAWVSFDETSLSWRRPLWFGQSFDWADITAVEVVKKNERHNAPDLVRVEHRTKGFFYLPVLVGLRGSWRDPDLEAKTARLIATWRAATTPALAEQQASSR